MDHLPVWFQVVVGGGVGLLVGTVVSTLAITTWIRKEIRVAVQAIRRDLVEKLSLALDRANEAAGKADQAHALAERHELTIHGPKGTNGMYGDYQYQRIWRHWAVNALGGLAARADYDLQPQPERRIG